MERNTNTLYILRFIAAIMVVLYHYSPPGVPTLINFFKANGQEAVNFFFFISGFVMVISNSKYIKNTNLDFSAASYYVKRLARIYPLYLFAILLLIVFHYGIKSIDTASVKYRLPFEILGVQRWLYPGSFNYPGWTISCEFFFYLFFPYILVFMRKHKNYKVIVWGYFIVCICLTCTLKYLVEHPINHLAGKVADSLFMNPIFLISVFIVGMLCGKVFIDNKVKFFQNEWKSRICVALCIIIIFLTKYYAPHHWGFLDGGILVPVYFIFVLAVTSFKNSGPAFVSNKLFIFLGEISYGIYIMQYPIYVFFVYYFTTITNGINLLLFILTLILICSVTYFMIEKTFKNLILTYFSKTN